jgi:hypothetical protein
MPPKDESISTGLAMKIGEIIGKLDQLIKSVDEGKVQTNGRMDDLEDRVNDLEKKHDMIAGGAKGVSLAVSVGHYLFVFGIGVVAFFAAHFVWDKHDEQAAKPLIVNPPAVVVSPPPKVQ